MKNARFSLLICFALAATFSIVAAWHCSADALSEDLGRKEQELRLREDEILRELRKTQAALHAAPVKKAEKERRPLEPRASLNINKFAAGKRQQEAKRAPAAKQAQRPRQQQAAPQPSAPQPSVAVQPIDEALKAVSRLETRLKELEVRLQSQNGAIEQLAAEKQRLQNELTIAQTRARELLQRLDQKERSVRILESQVDKLFSLLDVQLSMIERPQPVNEQQANLLQAAEDMPLAVVAAQNADLWTGPREEDKLLMSYPQGTPLRVETRFGNWYRVITPAGSRAWVEAQQVAFGQDANSLPKGMLRIKGYDSRIDGPGH